MVLEFDLGRRTQCRVHGVDRGARRVCVQSFPIPWSAYGDALFAAYSDVPWSIESGGDLSHRLAYGRSDTTAWTEQTHGIAGRLSGRGDERQSLADEGVLRLDSD